MHTHPEIQSKHENLFTAYVALACVCLFWGTTYLGIRIGLESFSPSILMSLRYSASGAVLLIGAAWRGARFPHGKELLLTALYGVMIIGFGTGALVIAEQWIPSGLAALIVSASPFWMTGVEALVPGGEPLHAPSVRGMLVGLLGVLFLVVPVNGLSGMTGGVGAKTLLGGFLLLHLGAAMWAVGAIAQRRIATEVHPFVSGGVQQLATGIVFAIPALLWDRHAVWNARGISAAIYLAIFGGVIGYSAFIFAMDRLPVAMVSIYNYVNPVVAVFLGWLFYREHFGWREAIAMVIIFVGVAMVKRASKGGRQLRG